MFNSRVPYGNAAFVDISNILSIAKSNQRRRYTMSECLRTV